MRVAMSISVGDYRCTYVGAKSWFMQRTRLRSAHLGSRPVILQHPLAFVREEASCGNRRP